MCVQKVAKQNNQAGRQHRAEQAKPSQAKPSDHSFRHTYFIVMYGRTHTYTHTLGPTATTTTRATAK